MIHERRSFFAVCGLCWGQRKKIRRDDTRQNLAAVELEPTTISQCEPDVPPSPLGRLGRLPPEIRNTIYSFCDVFPNYKVPLLPRLWPMDAILERRRQLRYPSLTRVSRQLRIETLSFLESNLQHKWYFLIHEDSWQRFQKWVAAIGNRPLFMEKFEMKLQGKIISSRDSPSKSMPYEINIQFFLSLNIEVKKGENDRPIVPNCVTPERTDTFKAIFEEAADTWIEKRAQNEFRAGDLEVAITRWLKVLHPVQPWQVPWATNGQVTHFVNAW